ncbi:UNVERIFIED_CONTAM: hypothetical protein K2H54_025798, partial [Gekko kuhli]
GYQFEEDNLVWLLKKAFEEGVKCLEQGNLPKTTHLQQNPDQMEKCHGAGPGSLQNTAEDPGTMRAAECHVQQALKHSLDGPVHVGSA